MALPQATSFTAGVRMSAACSAAQRPPRAVAVLVVGDRFGFQGSGETAVRPSAGACTRIRCFATILPVASVGRSRQTNRAQRHATPDILSLRLLRDDKLPADERQKHFVTGRAIHVLKTEVLFVHPDVEPTFRVTDEPRLPWFGLKSLRLPGALSPFPGATRCASMIRSAQSARAGGPRAVGAYK